MAISGMFVIQIFTFLYEILDMTDKHKFRSSLENSKIKLLAERDDETILETQDNSGIEKLIAASTNENRIIDGAIGYIETLNYVESKK